MHGFMTSITRGLSYMRSHKRRTFAAVALVVAAAIAVPTISACSGSPTSASSQDKESGRDQSSYDQLVGAAPAHEMTNPITRDTINFWIDTWNKPGALAYVYLQNANGDLIGYYVLRGLPVSYCTALTPNYTFVKTKNKDSQGNPIYAQVPAPGVDGVYYSGGDCARYYGKDATTGGYVEFTVGLGINMLLYNQPLTNHPNVPPLGPTHITVGKPTK